MLKIIFDKFFFCMGKSLLTTEGYCEDIFESNEPPLDPSGVVVDKFVANYM